MRGQGRERLKRNERTTYILDSFAVLSYLGQEAGAKRVKAILTDAESGQAENWLSIVNFGEVLYITERERGLAATSQTIAVVDQLPIAVAEVDRTLAFTAAHIKAGYSISYADAFAVALAQIKNGRVVTGDPEFEKVEQLIPIEWIPR